MSNYETQKRVFDHLDRLATSLDSQFSFLGFRFGIDALIGLVPGLGDVFGGLISIYTVLQMRRIGVSTEAINKMLIAIMIDVFVGGIPVIGDAFDFFFKVNERNVRLAKKDLRFHEVSV